MGRIPVPVGGELLFRELLAATGFFAPGPWRGVDPFAPMKRAEPADATATAETAHELAGLSSADRDAAVVRAAVRGNRADSAFQPSDGAGTAGAGMVSGLDPDTVAALDAEGEPWRTKGSYTLIRATPGERARHLGSPGVRSRR